jgi:hypothetical protein
MARVFEREMNNIIYEYQQKMQTILVKTATEYSMDIVERVDDFARSKKIIVEVKWPDAETKHSDDEVESPLQEGEVRQY